MKLETPLPSNKTSTERSVITKRLVTGEVASTLYHLIHRYGDIYEYRAIEQYIHEAVKRLTKRKLKTLHEKGVTYFS